MIKYSQIVKFFLPDVIFTLVGLQVEEDLPDGLVHVLLILEVICRGLEDALHVGVDVLVNLGKGILYQPATLCHAVECLEIFQQELISNTFI